MGLCLAAIPRVFFFFFFLCWNGRWRKSDNLMVNVRASSCFHAIEEVGWECA